MGGSRSKIKWRQSGMCCFLLSKAIAAELKHPSGSYLYELECSPDPAWYYLKRQEEALCLQLDTCGAEFRSKLEAEQKQNGPSQAQPVDSCSDDEKGAAAGHTRIVKMKPAQFVGNEETAYTYVCKLCTILEKSGPSFFVLANDIEMGKFVKVEKFSSLRRQTSQAVTNAMKPLGSRDDSDSKELYAADSVALTKEKSGERSNPVRKSVNVVVSGFVSFTLIYLFWFLFRKFCPFSSDRPRGFVRFSFLRPWPNTRYQVGALRPMISVE